ncbi:MAG: hypothetical protein OEY20_14830 [Gemmatimonadota bacterium]|nr:hypothetical protein [Gemmatimonadota bacterium]MDH5198514.1 hypothetical protein [Gemmatimonadota bacterium]
MRCAEIRELLLTEEIEVLRAPDGPLADHLKACAGCRAAADRILAAQAALEATATRHPHTTARAASERAVVEGRAAVRVRRMRRLVPALLTAAAITAILLVPRDEIPPDGVPGVAVHAALPPIVEGGANHVAVMATNRPDVTVVWEF